MKGIKRVLVVLSGAILVSTWGVALYYIWMYNEVVGGIATLGSLIGAFLAASFTEG